MQRVTPWPVRLGFLSVTVAIMVSPVYLPQSMLQAIAHDLRLGIAEAGAIATAAQLGYALGIFLFVPLSERVHSRRLTTILGSALGVALLACALAPGAVTLTVAFGVVGLLAMAGQIIIPAAGEMSPPAARGRTTATLVGALLVGIFGGRVIAGILFPLVGWRWVVVGFAILVLAVVALARRALAAELTVGASTGSYPRLLLSTLRVIRGNPVLVQSGLIQFLVFAGLNSLWTVAALHLTGPGVGWTAALAGLFGLVGVVAGFIVPFTGRAIDRFGALAVVGVILGVALVAASSALADSFTVPLFAASMFLLTWGNQSALSANQHRVLGANEGRPARANTVFMVIVFLGGSLGAAAGPIAYEAGGIFFVAAFACGAVILASAVWGWAVASARHMS